MTTKQIDDIKRLMAEATPRPWALHNETCVSSGDTMTAQTCDDEPENTPQAEQNAALIVAAVNALPSLLADLEAAQKREQVLRDELTRLRDVVSAVEYESIDAALADTEVKPCDSKLNAAARNALPSMLTDIEMLREALQAISQKHPGYGGSGDIARKALATTEVQP